MSQDNIYYRIYMVGHGMLTKVRLRLPDDFAKAFNKKVLSPEHKFESKQNAIDIMDAVLASGRCNVQIAVAELGISGSGDIIAISNYKKEVVRLDQ